MPTLTIENLAENARWSKAAAGPGENLGLSVDAHVKAKQHILFLIRHGQRLIDSVESKKGFAAAPWTTPNIPGETLLTFQALLCQKPAPDNGHCAVAQALDSADSKAGRLTLKGFGAAIASIDAYFAPKTETLAMQYSITDPHGAATAARIEVWGDRYPTVEPLYTENIPPKSGHHKWNWTGKANHGALQNKFITPEFSPYRARVVIGVNQAAVEHPFEDQGLGKAAIAEAPFEVAFKSFEIRVQRELTLPEATKTRFGEMLVVEPRTDRGEYAAVGRLPLETEPALKKGWAKGQPAQANHPGLGRLRIPSIRFNGATDALNQGTSAIVPAPPAPAAQTEHKITDDYMEPNGDGSPERTKYARDARFYSRPEIPLEFVPRLRCKSTDAQKTEHGVQEQDAVGPALFDVWADDIYVEDHYAPHGAPYSPDGYFKRAATQVKRGTHSLPYNVGANPEITYWQQRFVLAGPGEELTTTRDFDPAAVNPTTELTLYLNRTRMTRDEDYELVNGTKVRLKEKVGQAGDVVWVFRAATGAGATVNHWAAYPPGDNCHENYGGLRGAPPTDDYVGVLRKTFSAAPAAPKEPILGQSDSGAFPYSDVIELDPFKAAAAGRERVRSQALKPPPAPNDASAKYRGMAGIVFSPSYVGGDTYAIVAALTRCPYLRNLGFVRGRPVEPHLSARTGTLTVWRLATIETWRSPTEPDPKMKARKHPSDGRKMSLYGLNDLYRYGFTEWRAVHLDRGANPPAVKIVPGGKDPIRTVTKKIYRTVFNASKGAGYYDVKRVTDNLVQWDYFRVKLPRLTNQNRGSRIANSMKGADPVAVGQRVYSAAPTPGGPASRR